MPGENYKPLQRTLDRTEQFAALNEFVMARAGWITSIPGDAEIRIECLPDSELPDDLRRLGHHLREEGEGQRILAHAVTQMFTTGPDGSLQPATLGSSHEVTLRVTGAGLGKVKRYSFTLA
ncbi:hypothetical protein QMZ05_24630 [Bradyrhizobium sp. INPA03-11B]|uniref:hypothetical protein n=1 Tax=Bradyrhizobium sp. INPA03-11B TaxID=418598 RepID=UPI00338FCEC0